MQLAELYRVVYPEKIIRKTISEELVEWLKFSSIFQCVPVLGSVQFGNPIPTS